MARKKHWSKCKNCGKEYFGWGKIYCSRKCIKHISHEGIKGVNASNYLHGFYNTRFYGIWTSMRQRCNNLNYRDFYMYGGKKIKCEWDTFLSFKDDMYLEYLKHIRIYGRSNTSLDRINGNGNYCKYNCKWADRTIQNMNKPGITLLKIDETIRSLSGWSIFFGIAKNTVSYRIKVGWSFQRALNLPPSKTIKIVKNYYLG